MAVIITIIPTIICMLFCYYIYKHDQVSTYTETVSRLTENVDAEGLSTLKHRKLKALSCKFYRMAGDAYMKAGDIAGYLAGDEIVEETDNEDEEDIEETDNESEVDEEEDDGEMDDFILKDGYEIEEDDDEWVDEQENRETRGNRTNQCDKKVNQCIVKRKRTEPSDVLEETQVKSVKTQSEPVENKDRHVDIMKVMEEVMRSEGKESEDDNEEIDDNDILDAINTTRKNINESMKKITEGMGADPRMKNLFDMAKVIEDPDNISKDELQKVFGNITQSMFGISIDKLDNLFTPECLKETSETMNKLMGVLKSEK